MVVLPDSDVMVFYGSCYFNGWMSKEASGVRFSPDLVVEPNPYKTKLQFVI